MKNLVIVELKVYWSDDLINPLTYGHLPTFAAQKKRNLILPTKRDSPNLSVNVVSRGVMWQHIQSIIRMIASVTDQIPVQID